jgi:RHS repeat-associated protein
MTYMSSGNVLGNLTYTYDPAGHRTSVGGSLAQINVPGALASATYDAANELVNWSGTSLTYDADGNLTSDGQHTYNWNSRNQLAGISGSSSAVQYDAIGRRVKSPSGTSFLYDGTTAVQEQTNGAPTSNSLLGPRVDEILARQDSSGTYSFLRDALGSTVALTTPSGAVNTTYSYEPFGGTSTTPTESQNPTQYAARENDGNGLYYYRARYYSTRFQRFISEDPLGFRGGQLNLFEYVGNEPVSHVDPTGKSVSLIHFWETYNAATAVGYSPSDAYSLAQQVEAVDFRPNSQDATADAANGHGMGGTVTTGRYSHPQNRCEAYSGTVGYLSAAYANGDTAGALHAIEDSFAHQYGFWNGGSLGVHWPGWPHFGNDLRYMAQAEAAAEAFLSTSNPANFGAFLAPPPANCSQ